MSSGMSVTGGKSVASKSVTGLSGTMRTRSSMTAAAASLMTTIRSRAAVTSGGDGGWGEEKDKDGKEKPNPLVESLQRLLLQKEVRKKSGGNSSTGGGHGAS